MAYPSNKAQKCGLKCGVRKNWALILMSSIENHKIAKNTLFLYIRMILVVLVGLYTSRIVIKALGVSDYGIYNVMGGVIGMLAYINTLLAGSTSRFLTMDLGKNDSYSLFRTFGVTNTLCFLASIIIFILGETIGLWFMNTKLNIATERLYAANWVYQSALFASICTVIQTPYSASVISHEKMSFYAFVSILDAFLKLFVTIYVMHSDTDRLILYSFLIMCISLVNIICYLAYCKIKFSETTLKMLFDRKKIKDMMNYSGWNMVQAFANMLNNYGLNILLNVFFGTVVNAARGVALQVNNLVVQLYSNFQIASRPQIIKYYAQGEDEKMENLIFNTSKYSAYLLLCLIIPFWLNIDGILKIWLTEIPVYTAWFIRIMMLQSLCMSIDLPVGVGIQSVGKMKLPNISVALIYLSIFPITYFALKFGASPVTGYIIYVAISPMILAVDLLILKKYTGFSIVNYCKQVIIPILKISPVFIIFPIAVNYLIPSDSIIPTIMKTVIMIVYIILIIFFFCIPLFYKKLVLSKIRKSIK